MSTDLLHRTANKTEPPKQWRNWWRTLCPVEITHPGGVLDLETGALVRDALTWPSKEIAEQHATEQPSDGAVEWLGAFPEGVRP